MPGCKFWTRVESIKLGIPAHYPDGLAANAGGDQLLHLRPRGIGLRRRHFLELRQSRLRELKLRLRDFRGGKRVRKAPVVGPQSPWLPRP